MERKLDELKMRLIEVNDLESAAGVLSWDQSTYMPPASAPTRGRQMALLGQLAHEKFTDPAVGKLLDELRPYEESLPYDSDDASLIRITRREYEKSIRIPAEFLGEFMQHSAASYQAWTKARPENNFVAVLPNLEKTLEYSRRFADFFPGYEHIADPLIDNADYGMKASNIRQLFSELRKQQVPIVKAIMSQPAVDDSCLRRTYPEDQQLEFSKPVIEKIGYDFNRGRIDKTHHPFMTKFSWGDIRITTRFQKNFLAESLFSTIHETGHAMYELGIRQELDGTPLSGGTSAGVHESQSRMWENIVGRSRAFWSHFYPSLQNAFPEQLGNTTLDEFYRAVNKVEKSLIRTDADEVTYNLHVMLRFDLELALLEGKLAVKDLPEAWHARFMEDFGIRAPDDRDGVLQDVHWYAGTIGGSFQGYTLGNLIAAHFYETALNAHPGIPNEIAQGNFVPLRDWLTENIYQHGSKFTAPELIQRVTGGELSIDPYIRYLKSKFGELYQL
jgi:carboxypeptidase Taq